MKNLFFTAILLILMTAFSFGEQVNLFWDSVTTDIDGNPALVVFYNVYRGDAAGGPYAVIGTVPQATNPTYLDAGVDLTTDKFYVVTANDNTGQESGFSNEAPASAIPPGTPPSAPTVTITITVSP